MIVRHKITNDMFRGKYEYHIHIISMYLYIVILFLHRVVTIAYVEKYYAQSNIMSRNLCNVFWHLITGVVCGKFLFLMIYRTEER